MNSLSCSLPHLHLELCVPPVECKIETFSPDGTAMPICTITVLTGLLLLSEPSEQTQNRTHSLMLALLCFRVAPSLTTTNGLCLPAREITRLTLGQALLKTHQAPLR